jgi:predicted AAA+ superfamily ATPase
MTNSQGAEEKLDMIKRTYLEILRHHIKNYAQMIFICGARQAGKTTLSKMLITHERNYLNWDNIKHRAIILDNVFEYIEDEILANHLSTDIPALLVLDEIHKYTDWKNYLKGLYDQYKGQVVFIVTGSARLDIYHKGSDSLMGRYFLYHIYQLSIGELIGHNYEPGQKFWQPKWPASKDNILADTVDNLWQRLFNFGGYPEPFIKNDPTFYNRWQSLRTKQLFHEEIRDYTRVYDIDQLELMGALIASQAGGQLNYSSLATKIQKPESTVRSWMNILHNTYYCFSIPPWSNNVARSILKMPKIYLYDWSVVTDYGSKVENFVAVHLLKSVSYWNNVGLGPVNLYYLRDKQQREVDFLLVSNNQPWMLIEVKASDTKINDNLNYFGQQLQARHAIQLKFDADFVKINAFELQSTKVVPAATLLSQLL